MFVKIEDNKITSIANAKMDNDYQETDKEVVKGFDNTFYFLEETQTPEYLARKKVFEEEGSRAYRTVEKIYYGASGSCRSY